MNAAHNQPVDFGDCSFAQIAEVYQRLSAIGEAPPIDALVEFAPHLENEIRTRIPMISLLDKTMGAKLETVEPPNPDAIAGCLIENEIGRGGMGVVYRARQPELNRDVAIKIIRLNYDNADQSKRFELERHAMAKLDHPNIVPAYSFTQDRHYAYLVMKLVQGYGLNQLLEGKGDYKAIVQMTHLKTDWSALATLGADVASGLQHAHESGLVHRDIKPGNLLLDENGKVWITDFGLAKMLGVTKVISRTGDMVGTPRYMSPEQIQGIADARSDVYSLGMTLYEIAAGQGVRGGDWKPSGVLEGSLPQIEPIRNINPHVPEDLAFVIMKACKFLPEDRYQTALEMEVVLRRFVDGRVADRRKKKRKPDAVFRKEFRLKAGLAIVGSMIFFSALTYFLMSDGRSNKEKQIANHSPSINLIDFLADGKSRELDEKVGAQLRDALSHATEELKLPEEERRELIAEANVLFDQLRSEEMTHQEFGAILDNYKGSNLATATRIWRAVPIIERSNLSAAEKSNANSIVHRFAFLATKDRLSSAEISRMINELTYGKSVAAWEIKSMRFSDNHLRQWIDRVDRNTKDLVQPGEKVTVADEIRSLFSSASGVSNSGNISIGIPKNVSPQNLSPELIKEYQERIDELQK